MKTGFALATVIFGVFSIFALQLAIWQESTKWFFTAIEFGLIFAAAGIGWAELEDFS